MRPWNYYLPLVEVNAMRYSQFGDTGLIVSKLAFGAMTFGTDIDIRVIKFGKKDKR